MKKILPVIILLLSLSLVGIVFIQLSWFQSMMQNKEEELQRKVVDAMNVVGQELMEQKGTIPSLKNSRPKPFSWPSDQLLMELMKPSTIAEKFTEFEINEKLQNAFKSQGLKDTKFEFAITSNVNFFTYEIKSKNFMKVVDDTTHNWRYVYLLQPPSGSNMEGLTPEETLMVIMPNYKNFLLRQMRWMIGGSVVFTLIIIAAFLITLTTLLRQKKLSEIKNDFINNMTHEFKTPIATISLAVDALKNEKVIQDVAKRDYFSGIIKEENRRMNKQVETILQAALMDRQEVQLTKKPVKVHEVVQHVIENFDLQLQDKNGQLVVDYEAKNDLIDADEVHFTNLISNLVDNAVKYSKDNVVIKIETTSNAKWFQIKIEDNGIGMSKETVKRIFEKFFRAHTGNIHNVKGFGLGLSYVKNIVDAHGGKIKVDSTLGKGTSFTIDLPLHKS
jgi:two-component system, OmpR family, phosphate regulon sensor histidine kinase PhoR